MDEKLLLYAETHEWAHLAGDVCTVGITRFAVEQLTDITYIELPKVGRAVKAGESFGVIESVKSANDLYAPVAGEVFEINAKVADDPAILNQDPYDAGWIVKLKCGPAPDTNRLKDKSGYDAHIASQAY